jgi:O-antigen/teichoic acid export membrane protein
LALGAVITLALGDIQRPLPQLWLVFVLGPVAFLIAFWVQVRHRVRAGSGALTREERRASLRESFVFFVGAGSSMTMQYLPVIIAGRLQETTTAAILFGAVQATAPLLLLSRIYGAVMMPAFAGAADDTASHGHLRLIQPYFLPSLAVALGLAPWVVVSLGVAPTGSALSVGGLVALMTLMQVWATPAVTILSARKRELIPALASLGGLAVASLIWVLSVRTGVVLLLPVGLAVGAVVRSLVPMWVISGARLGRFDRARLAGLVSGVAVALSLLALSWAPTAIALGGGAFLVLIGLVLGYRAWPRATGSVDAHPAR